MERAIFLDRDGTLIEDVGYPHKIEQIKFLPQVAEAITLSNSHGFKVIIVTNQSGVARGYFTEDAVVEFNRYIVQALSAQGAIIDAVYFCPHHVEGAVERYRKDCTCRKPRPGMIQRAAADLDIELARSFVVGDKMSDVEAGRRATCKTVLLNEQNAVEAPDPLQFTDFIAPSLLEAVRWAIKLTWPEQHLTGLSVTG